MCSRNCLTLLLAAAASSVALGADPVSYTDPVGFVKLGNTAADGGVTIDAVPPNTDVRLTIPLERQIEFSGTVSATTPNSVTFNGSPSWATDLWTPATGEPYTAIIASGAENGVRGVITSHTADTLTMIVTTPGDLTNVSMNDSVVIRQAWTIKSIVDGATIPNGSKILLWTETLEGINQPASVSYTYGLGDWYDKDGVIQNNVIIYPGESFVLRSSGSSVPSFAIFGDVPTSALRNSLAKDGSGAEDLHVSSMSPVPQLLVNLSIPVENGDKLLVFDPASVSGINSPASASFTFGLGMWFDKNGVDVSNSLTMTPGLGYIVRRASSSAAYAEWTESAP